MLRSKEDSCRPTRAEKRSPARSAAWASRVRRSSTLFRPCHTGSLLHLREDTVYHPDQFEAATAE